MNVFNPEHDLCTANGSPNFVPPDSALEFGRNCEGLTRWIEEAAPGAIVPWGWDSYLKRQLQKQGVPDSTLPSDRALAEIRALSHRRTALEARDFLDNALRPYRSLLTSPVPVEITSTDRAAAAVEEMGSTVLKAPWSGSGKGLRWVRRGEFSPSDEGWCRRTIARQGSIIVEKRFDVVQDFAMLWHIAPAGVTFEGYSLFRSENGMYRTNLLASDETIQRRLAQYVPLPLLASLRESLTVFLDGRFRGRYEGYAGVDMFIAGGPPGSKYLLDPCVEINVRMTMGLLARKVFDRLGDSLGDGTHSLSVEYRPRKGELAGFVTGSGARPLHRITEENRYAVIIIKN